MRLEHYESMPSPGQGQQEKISELGRKMVEDAAEKRGKSEAADKVLEHFENEVLNPQKVEESVGEAGITSKEDFQTVTEDLQFGNNSALYSTQIADFIEREFRPRLVAEGIIKTINVNQGYDSIKVPKQPDLQNASTVADDGTLTDDSADYTSLTISTDFIGLRSTMTVELLRQANVDLLEDQLRQISFAISKKVDADIIAEMDAATTPTNGTYGDNSNYLYLGTGNDVTYDDMVTAYYDMVANNAEPAMFLCSPNFAKELFNDADVKDAVAFGTQPSGEDADVVPRIQSFLGKPVMVSSQVGAERGYWIDRERIGYLVNKTGIETMDQQLDNKAAFEVKAVKGFGVGITKPQALYKIEQQADTPT